MSSNLISKRSSRLFSARWYCTEVDKRGELQPRWVTFVGANPTSISNLPF